MKNTYAFELTITEYTAILVALEARANELEGTACEMEYLDLVENIRAQYHQ